jgi:hypothetical protein
MTEAEWLACTEPILMLEARQDTVTERQLLLFVCACARRVWHLLDEQWRNRMEGVELLIEGQITYSDLIQRRGWDFQTDTPSPAVTVEQAADEICDYRHLVTINNGNSLEERAEQAKLLRDIIDNPFRPASVNPDWLNWNAGTARKIAQAIYEERAFDRMPILADALEDAGCTERAILDHCRQPGEHVRGCWVVDLFLGKS